MTLAKHMHHRAHSGYGVTQIVNSIGFVLGQFYIETETYSFWQPGWYYHKSYFGMITTKILKPVFMWHSPYIINEGPEGIFTLKAKHFHFIWILVWIDFDQRYLWLNTKHIKRSALSILLIDRSPERLCRIYEITDLIDWKFQNIKPPNNGCQ